MSSYFDTKGREKQVSDEEIIDKAKDCFKTLLSKNQLSPKDAETTNATLLGKMIGFLKNHHFVNRAANICEQYTLLFLALLPYTEYLNLSNVNDEYEPMSLFFSNRNYVIKTPLLAGADDVKQMIGFLLILMMSMDFKREHRTLSFGQNLMNFCHGVIEKKFFSVSETASLIMKKKKQFIEENVLVIEQEKEKFIVESKSIKKSAEEAKAHGASILKKQSEMMDSLFTLIWVEISHRNAAESDTIMFTVNIVLTLLYLFQKHDKLKESVERVSKCFGHMVNKGLSKPNSAGMKVSSLMFEVSVVKYSSSERRKIFDKLKQVAMKASRSVSQGLTFDQYLTNATGLTPSEYFKSIKDKTLSDADNDKVTTALLQILNENINGSGCGSVESYTDLCMEDLSDLEDPPVACLCLGYRIGLVPLNKKADPLDFCIFHYKKIFPSFQPAIADMLHQFAWKRSFDISHTAVFFCIIYYISNIILADVLNSKIEYIINEVHEVVTGAKRKRTESMLLHIVNSVYDRITDCADEKGTMEEKQRISETLKRELLLIVPSTGKTGLQRKENENLDVFKVALAQAFLSSSILLDFDKPVEISLIVITNIVNAAKSSKFSSIKSPAEQRLMLEFSCIMQGDKNHTEHLDKYLAIYAENEEEEDLESSENDEEETEEIETL